MIRMWTDGSCPFNPGPGGWGLVVVEDGEIVAKLHGGEAETTNNRMELMAVIEAMRFARRQFPGQPVEIISDSEYVVKGTTEWMAKWKSRGWRKGGGGIKNLAHWKEIDQLYTPNMTLTWVRGHDGDEMNELADHLAGMGTISVSKDVADPEDEFEARFV